MVEIAGREKGAQCLIVGDGEERLALENLACALNVKDRVHFISSDLDTPRLFSIMDVFVFPSVREGLGIALLEAMAAGKACVASDTGGISDIIRDSSCGILVPVGDIRAIAESVSILLNNKVLRQNIGLNARRLVAEKFSLDVMSDKVIQLYKEVLGE
jgi:glycosyltransferase involved in cell wall biosynthesis